LDGSKSSGEAARDIAGGVCDRPIDHCVVEEWKVPTDEGEHFRIAFLLFACSPCGAFLPAATIVSTPVPSANEPEGERPAEDGQAERRRDAHGL
jgi:hypothetical protein